jgi:hypothetical protein
VGLAAGAGGLKLGLNAAGYVISPRHHSTQARLGPLTITGATGTSGARRGSGATGPTSRLGAAELYSSDVAAYNQGTARRIAATLSFAGDLDCVIDAVADFPDETLITVINSSGDWYQFVYNHGQLDLPAMRSGSDYTSALPNGESWQDYKAQSDVNCTIDSTGQITIS